MGYSLNDFKITIPDELIAQFPSDKRQHAKLLLLNIDNGNMRDEVFFNIGSFLGPTDCVVYNDAKVINARLHGYKVQSDGGKGGQIEILLTRRITDRNWQCLIRPSRRVKQGSVVTLKDGTGLRVMQSLGEGAFSIAFSRDIAYADLLELGDIPLPKYIKRKPLEMDDVRYQTVFSRKYGAVASPTAGLHFTEHIIENLKARGTRFVPITLHVDWGTFKPIREDDYREHRIHSEQYEISESTAEAVNLSREEGRRVVCVGTTSVRALESAADGRGLVHAHVGETDLYIYPGYSFKVVDALITNFHMPDSSLILLVSAFAGKERIEKAYAHAVKQGYRFYSYGDTMFMYRGSA